jgi:nucleoid DNA-binding protein
MKDIYQIINQLITEHQELELPEFGKFSGEIMEAEIHPVDHRFMPKYLKIDFQLDKNANGNLIIDKLSDTNKISKAEAKNELLDFRNEILQKLKKGEKVVLKELGYMSWKAGHLYFEQDLKFNYLKESFGLSSFTQKPHQEVVPNQEAKPELQEITASKSYKRLIFGVAASVVVLALAGLIYLRWDGILNVYKNKIANRNDNVEVNKTESIQLKILLNL